MPLIEQLHYTWAPRGVEGINRFQIAALSPGFKDGRLRAVLPVVRKICRYDRPRGTLDAPPISFGWFDHKNHRIAFSRVGLPPIRGKVGNFAAHIVVGPPAALRESDLASTFGASFWWTGATDERADLELPAVDFDEVLDTRSEAGPADPEPVLALLRALLILPGDGRLAVIGGADVFGKALRTVARRVPEALDGLSLSTYEGAPTYPFRVVGTSRPSAGQHRCSLVPADALDGLSHATAERLVMHGPRSALLRTAARAQAGRAGGSLWSSASKIVALATADASGGDDAEVLATADAVAYLSSEEPGRRRLAELALTGSAGVAELLRQAAPQIAPDQRVALYGEIERRFVGARDARGCARVVRTIADRATKDRLLAAALEAAVGSSPPARDLSADDLVAILAHAGRQRVSAESLSGMLGDGVGQIARCAAAQDVPDAYVLFMFRHLLQRSPSSAADVADALRRRPRMLEGVALDADDARRCQGLLTQLDGQRLEAAVRALLPSLASHADASELRSVLDALDSIAAAGCVLAAAETTAGPVISELCDDSAALLLRSASDADGLALRLLEASRSDDHPLAERLLRGLLTGRGPHPLHVVWRTADIAHAGLRAGLFRRAIAATVAEVRQLADVAEVWRELRTARPSASEPQILRLLLEHAAAAAGGQAGAMVLAWIARSLLPEFPSLLSKGRLRDPDANRLALELAAAMPESSVKELEPYIRAADRRSRAWWSGLAAYQRRATADRMKRASRH